MGNPAVRQSDRFVYADYLTWPGEERWELIEGVAYDMTPAPAPQHQRVLAELIAQFVSALRGNPCEVFPAPFDVRLPEEGETDERTSTVVQPDLSVVCDPKKIDDRGCRGAPDFVLEILSPATAARDQIQKVALYEKHGVREYWILHPVDAILTVRRLLDDGTFSAPRMLEAKGQVAVTVLPGLTVDLDSVFGRPPSEPADFSLEQAD